MKNCPNCRNQVKDEALFCPVCGTMLDALPQPSADYFKPVPDPVPVQTPVIEIPDAHNHTADFNDADIRETKLACMCAYLLDVVGVIISLLMCPASPYARFHVRQSLKFTVLEVLITLASALLFWTFLVPIAGLIGLAVLWVLKLICFLDVCKGQANDAPLVRNLKFFN